MDVPHRGRSLRGRLLLGAIAVMTPVLLGAGIWLLLISRSTADYKDLVREAAVESDESVALLTDLTDAEAAGHQYIETGDPASLRQFRRTARRVERALDDPGAYDESAEIRGLSSIRRPWTQATREVVSGTGSALARHDRFADNIEVATAGLEQLMAGFQEEIGEDLVVTERSAELNWLLGAAAILFSLVLAALLANRLSRALVRPLEELAVAARSVAAGRLGHRVEVSTTAELNEVGTTFNAMAEALEDQREELERHAFADALTGLPNRALFEDRASHALERMAGRGERAAVLVIDLDGFKLVNDGLGHSCGDSLLQQAAGRMSATLRPSDTLARLGSDEFAVLLENVRGLDDALGAAERLRQAFHAPFTLKGSEVLITASVGIALSTDSVRDESELLRRADRAMYRVKQRGRNASEFFDPEMDDQAGERLATLNALRRALDRGELVVQYQPIVDLDSGDVRAAEALLRWRRPVHGLIAPLTFIPLAEQTGLIVSLGAWVLHEACAEAQRWADAGVGEMPVTVNVSARQLLDPEFESTVAEALRSSGLAPSLLALEVTESSVMQQPEVTVPKLDRISSTGVHIALDDFGEGYSSLGQLRELPIDILKIARPFIRELTQNTHDPALLKGIIELGRSLGLRMVAEGVEYPEQHAILRAFDCPLGQGFLFSRPLEAEVLRGVLRERRAAVR
jgi:diguanylate cyclase (GGDEF)-like protein